MKSDRIRHGVLTPPVPCGIPGCPICDRSYATNDPTRDASQEAALPGENVEDAGFTDPADSGPGGRSSS